MRLTSSELKLVSMLIDVYTLVISPRIRIQTFNKHFFLLQKLDGQSPGLTAFVLLALMENSDIPEAKVTDSINS